MIFSTEINGEGASFEFDKPQRKAEFVKKGDAFFCFTTNKDDCVCHAKVALENGANVVFSNFDLTDPSCVKIDNVRSAFSRACAKYYGNVCDKMKMIGVTGTNGKTTTCHLISQILSKSGKKVGVIGTNGAYFCGKSVYCPLTTPDADFLHKTFSQMYQNGVEYVIMEVSAHAIVQGRVDGIMYDVGVLTNITQDHLDYFGDMENYANAKAQFFTREHIKKAIFGVDDERVREIMTKTEVPFKTFGMENPADTFAIDGLCDINGSRFVANACDEVFEVKTNLIGDYNIENSLAALAVCCELGLSEKELASGLNFVYPAEGRFNVLKVGNKYAVVDFAHTPDGLEKVLQTARNLTDKRVIVVFGCGGNRDRDKRPRMGKIAQDNADVVCLTSDNPRYEEPEDIIADIECGIEKEHFVEVDRKKAIRKMLDFAESGDIVIIAGKGAEKTQEVDGILFPYNDFDVVSQYCAEKLKGERSL